MVWLFNSAIPRGQHKKFHRPWSGPYTIVKELSETTYRIQHCQQRSRRHVVHFDRLKRFTGVVQPSPQHMRSSDQPQLPSASSTSSQLTEPTLQLLDCGDSDSEENDEQSSSSRYPPRIRHPPRRLNDYVRH